MARACNRRKIPYSPGCGSASQISQAEEPGCEMVKVFPGGVACVGMGSNLVTKELLKAGDYAGITAKVRDTLDLIRKIRGGK